MAFNKEVDFEKINPDIKELKNEAAVAVEAAGQEGEQNTKTAEMMEHIKKEGFLEIGEDIFQVEETGEGLLKMTKIDLPERKIEGHNVDYVLNLSKPELISVEALEKRAPKTVSKKEAEEKTDKSIAELSEKKEETEGIITQQEKMMEDFEKTMGFFKENNGKGEILDDKEVTETIAKMAAERANIEKLKNNCKELEKQLEMSAELKKKHFTFEKNS